MSIWDLSFTRSNRKIIALNTRHASMPFDLKSCKMMPFEFPLTSPGERDSQVPIFRYIQLIHVYPVSTAYIIEKEIAVMMRR